MFYYLKVNFADITYEQGGAPDFSRAAWTDVKETLGLEYPNLPYLIDRLKGLAELGQELHELHLNGAHGGGGTDEDCGGEGFHLGGFL